MPSTVLSCHKYALVVRLWLFNVFLCKLKYPKYILDHLNQQKPKYILYS